MSRLLALIFARQPFETFAQVQCRRHLIHHGLKVSSLGLALAMSTLVQADSADVHFSGSVAAPTCSVSGAGGAVGVGEGISLELGGILVNQLRPAGQWATHGKQIILRVDCPGSTGGYRTARATFDSASGSGIDPSDGRLLRLTGDSTAQNVAVGVWRPGSTAPLDLRTRPSLTAGLLANGVDTRADISVSIVMSRTSATPSAGTANAQLPFLLSYE